MEKLWLKALIGETRTTGNLKFSIVKTAQTRSQSISHLNQAEIFRRFFITMCPGIPCNLQVWSPDHQEHLGTWKSPSQTPPHPSIRMFHLTRPQVTSIHTDVWEAPFWVSFPKMGRQLASLTRSWGTRRSRWSTRLGKRSCAPSGHRGSHRWSGRSVPSEEGRWHEGTAESPVLWLFRDLLAFLRSPALPTPSLFLTGSTPGRGNLPSTS